MHVNSLYTNIVIDMSVLPFHVPNPRTFVDKPAWLVIVDVFVVTPIRHVDLIVATHVVHVTMSTYQVYVITAKRSSKEVGNFTTCLLKIL